ncbi:hypothetical protein [Longimicrobium sp.]|uniref:hypothetical protein n=1 Tax=Longimicrobium sp. TaxID=2029185 RepID=UPI003B3B87DA
MRKLLLRLLMLASVVLTLGACADTPTQSDHAPDLAAPVQDEQTATPQGCVSEGLCVLPPISGGWCEPWMELDWDCDEGGGECEESIGAPTDPEEAAGVQSCPGGGDGGSWGGYTPPPGGTGPGDPGAICIESYSEPCAPECEDCNPPEKESTICPSPFLGNVQPTLITVAGRNHEFSFTSTFTYPFKRLTGGRSPATYEIGLPTASKDAWWIAQAGTITVWCRGAWITRRHWVGTLTVVDSDLHMVMGPGHPDF